ncbi:Zinc finger C2H2-type,Zinc finger, RING/FYVE/PHD-type [Cinara cedri]|uniref:Zinc finger C2H2-type,Zinc finger, RING/FYVE/PHD-type n=1 Tax=Cinara cedri TaxID=506608 RepID=A0A5E4LXR1_9HEMI|nr:Zinc finger C2H2-type,Zinc finger, RING/FYVE/PHD-type [Cinara cedri]
MHFVRSNPMPVADHFLAPLGRDRGGGGPGTTEASAGADRPALGEVCETCLAYCSDKADLWRHARRDHGADPALACRVPGCGKRFFAAAMSAAHAAHHRLRADDAVPLTCELCGCLRQNIPTFRKHMVTAHPEAAGAFCGVCGSYVADVPSLVDHVRRRHGETPGARNVIRCDVCGQQYGNYRIMHEHRTVHGLVDTGLVRRSPKGRASVPRPY